MLVASLNDMIKVKVSQLVEKASTEANTSQSDFFKSGACSVDGAMPWSMRHGPGPHPRYRMISYDDMLAD